MSESESPTNAPANHSDGQGAPAKRRFAFWIRVGVFIIVVLGCGWYSRFFQSTLTTVSPLACADGNAALFAVDFNGFPVRLEEQSNLCTGIGDGECHRIAGDEIIRGECLDGRMHGPWSVRNTKLGTISWSGSFCNGLPCGEFHRRLEGRNNAEYVFRVENMHIHGNATIWENEADHVFEVSGRFEHGKRVGRWVRHLELEHRLYSAVIYDENGFVSTTTFYCTNGNRKEIRGKGTFLLDAQNNTIATSWPVDPRESDAGENPNAGANDPSLCPLP